MKFSLAQKIYIAAAIKRDVARLIRTWDRPIGDKERAIMTAVADAIRGLPAKE